MIRAGDTPIGHELVIPFHDWNIYIDLSDDEMSEVGVQPDLCICDKDGKDITDEFLTFHPEVMNIRPTGANLFKMMSILNKIAEDR